MSMFDAEIAVQSAQVGVPTPEALEAGASPHVEVGITAGMMFPVPNPQTGGPLIVPVGKIRFSFSREQAIDFFTSALEAASSLPESVASSGKLLVASNMSQVEAAAQDIKRVTGQ